ncbi:MULTISPECIES: helix-turn-helix domain-containing protein [unclassified Lactococcus]|uniref:helix-turn-helix domain-containing protein n=1 Tax=unclassified Lactococcus TaxID=2643510 RepID=UPI0011CAEE41|nr:MULTISPECIES: Rgg/GadR/MutR family transcriptional regulator [unclassified Lactococcus]MQW24001.1 transcriptional regulator [Lactococcus sp. dk101]TXK36778.1 transcriptional regulator [Lactococcus sp. dk310]TXK47528.1 transcriptional regulator [Lactococcus sp. dk322]
MSKEMDFKIGKTVSILRENKRMSLKEMTAGAFSESQLAKFEKGETNLTVSKFFKLLDNSNIYLDEFQHIYEDYVASEELKFQQELAEAYPKRDIKIIKKWLNYWHEKAKEEPEKKSNKINEIVVKSILAMTQESIVFKEDVLFLTDYLDEVSEWGRYEIWIFANCLRFFDDNSLKYYGLYILGKTNFYQSVQLNKRMVIRVFLNLIDTFLKRNNLIFAKKYINHLEEMKISIDFMYEKIILQYHKGHYHYLQHYDSGKATMTKCAETLEEYGFLAEARNLYEEIKNL